jgi:hypothetical protein
MERADYLSQNQASARRRSTKWVLHEPAVELSPGYRAVVGQYSSALPVRPSAVRDLRLPPGSGIGCWSDSNSAGSPPDRRRIRLDYRLGWFTIRQIPVVAQQVHGIITGYYPRLPLAPGQRFASKGGYLVRFADPAGARVAALSDWLIP